HRLRNAFWTALFLFESNTAVPCHTMRHIYCISMHRHSTDLRPNIPINNTAPYALLIHIFLQEGNKNLVSYSCSIKIITAVRHRSKIRYQASQTARPSNHIPQPSSQTTTGILTCPTAAPPLVLIFHSLKSPNVPGLSTLTAGTSIFPDRLSRR
ncbi:hypothetical protein EDD15DRAFT_2247347, partial [Pisolithus albus]